MKKVLNLTAGLVFCGLAGLCQADGFSYTYVQGEYYHYDDVEIDSGISVSGAFALNEQLHLLGGYQTADMETFFGDIEVSQIKAGVGAHTSIAYGTDLVFEGALLDVTAEAGGHSQSEMGYEIAAGVRHKLSDRFEGNLGLKYTDISDMDIDETSVSVGGRLYFNENISAGAHYHNVEGDDFFKSSLRMSFL